MTRALLEQALVALVWHKQQTRPIDTTDIAIEAIRAELAKPAPYDQTALELCETCGWKTLIPTDGCLNCERSTQPAWHEAPNAPGLWIAAYPQPTAVRIDDVQALDRVKAWPGNWFGPLPEDRK